MAMIQVLLALTTVKFADKLAAAETQGGAYGAPPQQLQTGQKPGGYVKRLFPLLIVVEGTRDRVSD